MPTVDKCSKVYSNWCALQCATTFILLFDCQFVCPILFLGLMAHLGTSLPPLAADKRHLIEAIWLFFHSSIEPFSQMLAQLPACCIYNSNCTHAHTHFPRQLRPFGSEAAILSIGQESRGWKWGKKSSLLFTLNVEEAKNNCAVRAVCVSTCRIFLPIFTFPRTAIVSQTFSALFTLLYTLPVVNYFALYTRPADLCRASWGHLSSQWPFLKERHTLSSANTLAAFPYCLFV